MHFRWRKPTASLKPCAYSADPCIRAFPLAKADGLIEAMSASSRRLSIAAFPLAKADGLIEARRGPSMTLQRRCISVGESRRPH